MIDKLLAETTDCDFKQAVEIKKPKSWLKSVSAFANGIGGTLLFGVSDDGTVVGLENIKKDAEDISRFIKERIAPIPEFVLKVQQADNKKDVLVLTVVSGEKTPFYYVGDGNTVAYIRVGNESIHASEHELSELVMKGRNLTFDYVTTNYNKNDLAFSIFEATYKKITKKAVISKDYASFGMSKEGGKLTYAGLLFADDCPLLQSRIFCTRWNGLTKGSIYDDALDDKEFEGDLISLLKYACDFVNVNSKVRWKKVANGRINKPDYAERAVFEALANALMHRDYSIVGSEVHIDMYDDRIEICSPGGMYDGTMIQELNIEEVSSRRRNPYIADIFHRLDYVERRGSGLKKIQDETKLLYGYTDKYAPKFLSSRTDFRVVLMNLNFWGGGGRGGGGGGSRAGGGRG
ncbi:MAG: ATP-binding protein, partial [Lachnospiraceae bacterium]